jgi:trigger factor
MKSSVMPLEGNKVKVTVEVDETEFDRAVDAAFRKIAHEVRIPGFRPGKAPRRILEARLGPEVARGQALQDAMPEWYGAAVRELDVDVIAPPEIDITAGEDEGPVAFDAVVEVRPSIEVAGYASLRVELARPEATDEELDNQIDRLRAQFGELTDVERPVVDGDFVSIDITGSRDGEPLPGLQAEDYLYEVGTGSMAAELDEALRGSVVGDELAFDAQPADAEQEPVSFEVVVKGVQEKVLPEVTDEWASEASEFDTVAELRADLADRLVRVRRSQGRLALGERVAESLAALVVDEPPSPLVQAEMQNRIQELSLRLSAQNITAEQYLAMTNTSQEKLGAELGEAAVLGVKVDLALRAVADAEAIVVDEDDVDAEIEAAAPSTGETPAKLRARLDRDGRLPGVRSDLRKRKALDWLIEHVELVDPNGQPFDRALLEDPEDAEQEVTEQE